MCEHTSNALNAISFRGASPPDPPPGALPLDPHWGLCPQIPVIGLRYCARHTAGYSPPLYFLLAPPLAACDSNDTW